MGSYNRVNFLVSNKDYALKASGIDIDVLPSGIPGDDCRYNASPGEILIIDLATRKTINAAGIATVKKFGIAQATGSNGCATDLKWLFHPDFNFCEHKLDVKVASPNCGQGQILDVYLPNCTKNDTTLGFGVWLDDSFVRSTNGYNNKLLYNWTVNNSKQGCTDCDETSVCDELICALVDKINSTNQPDPTKYVHGIHADMAKKFQPFRAARLYPGVGTTKNFCLTPTGSGCDECAYIPAITGIELDGVDHAFAYTVDPSDNTRSLTSQIDRIVALMNKELIPRGGYAYRMKGIGKCCEYGIQVNTCIASVQLMTNAANIVPCSVANVAATKDSIVICKDCSETPDPEALTCGIRLFVDTIQVPCHCAYPPNLPPPNTYIRRIQADVLGGDVGSEYIYVNEVQPPENPEGFGYYYQDKERYQSNGGPGKDWRYTNSPFGDLQLPDEASRDSNTSVDCEEMYCVYDFEINYSALNNGPSNALRFNQRDLGRVLIRSKSSVLRTAWELVLVALKNRGICSNIDTTCTP